MNSTSALTTPDSRPRAYSISQPQEAHQSPESWNSSSRISASAGSSGRPASGAPMMPSARLRR